MECYVVQDLLPLYAEQLVSAETAADLQAHLEACAVCAQIYAHMEQPSVPEVAAPEDIRPLKKIKRRNRAKIAVISLCAAVVMTLFFLFGVYGIVPIRSDRLQMELTVYWESIDSNGEYHRYDTAAEADEDAKERICIDFKGDCIEMRNTVSSTNWWHHRGEPDGIILTNNMLAFYPTVLPGTFHRQYWATMRLDVPVIDGSIITIHCRDYDFVYELTDLATRARNGETVMTVGQPL